MKRIERRKFNWFETYFNYVLDNRIRYGFEKTNSILQIKFIVGNIFLDVTFNIKK